jgi:hypothetical protein
MVNFRNLRTDSLYGRAIVGGTIGQKTDVSIIRLNRNSQWPMPANRGLPKCKFGLKFKPIHEKQKRRGRGLE